MTFKEKIVQLWNELKDFIKTQWRITKEGMESTTDWYEEPEFPIWWEVITAHYPTEYRIFNMEFAWWVQRLLGHPGEDIRLSPPRRRQWHFSIRRGGKHQDKLWKWKTVRKLKLKDIWNRLKVQIPFEIRHEIRMWKEEHYHDPLQTDVNDYKFKPDWFCWGYQGPAICPEESGRTVVPYWPRTHWDDWADDGYDPDAGSDEERWTFMSWELPGMVLFWYYYCSVCQFEPIPLAIFTFIWVVFWFDWHHARPSQNPIMFW